MKIYKTGLLFILIIVFFLHVQLSSQAKSTIPDGFRNLRLGMSLEDIKAALQQDAYFRYRGDPDVSMLDKENKSSIECSGSSFIEKAYFQFDNQLLYIIIFDLNRNTLDYFTMFTTLKDKYGEPLSLDPSSAVWEDGATRISLEKPLSVKYLDMNVFNNLIENQKKEFDYREYSIRNFLSEF